MKSAHFSLLFLLLCAAMAIGLASTPTARAASAEAGSVQFTRAAESDFDAYTKEPTAGEQQSMRDRFWRMRTYAPYFDSKLSWYRDAWTYKDMYAVYSDGDEADRHPDRILKDAQGNRLYIPFDCNGQTCTQYAGDFGDPGFRAQWIAGIKEQAANYRGVFVDDVNMEVRVGNAKGETVMPQDPRTGKTMTEADYRRYVAEFTEQIKAALPGKEIVHNALWWVDQSDPYVRRQLDAATHIELERGVDDDGLRGGKGQWSYERFMKRIDWLHSRGKGVIFDSGADDQQSVEYELASYFLVSSGRDGVGTPWRSTPHDWWQGYDVQLGAPRGDRYEWNGMLRRDFANGFVVVNQPDSPARTVRLPSGSRAPGGEGRGAVRLNAGQGRIVVGRVPPRVGRPLLRIVTNPLTRLRARSSRTSRPVVRRARRTAQLKGRVRRANGGRVTVSVQRRVRGGWKVARKTVTRVSRTGSFKRTFRSLPRGKYRLQASYGGQRGATSVRHFRIRR